MLSCFPTQFFSRDSWLFPKANRRPSTFLPSYRYMIVRWNFDILFFRPIPIQCRDQDWSHFLKDLSKVRIILYHCTTVHLLILFLPITKQWGEVIKIAVIHWKICRRSDFCCTIVWWCDRKKLDGLSLLVTHQLFKLHLSTRSSPVSQLVEIFYWGVFSHLLGAFLSYYFSVASENHCWKCESLKVWLQTPLKSRGHF